MSTNLTPATIAVLSHLKVHGLSTRSHIKAHVPGLPVSTLNNLLTLKHISVDHTTTNEARYNITPRGLAKLAAPNIPLPKPKTQAKAEAQAATALDSNQQTEQSILDTLRRATTSITLPEVAKRMGRTLDIVRPSMTTLVQAGSVIGSNGKPARYRLPEQPANQRARTRGIHNASASGDYLGEQLQRNPGIRPERFVAFTLPSRVGNRLHWPDGRVTPFDQHPGLPA
jgi:hypothetical protein